MEHPYGWLSFAPPVVAVVLAIATRRILVSLLLGVFAGALLTTGGDPVRAVVDLCETHLWATFTQPSKLRLFAFTMTMGATIGLLHRAGGMLGFVQLMTPLAGTRRNGQLTGWVMGMAVFFDDYANTLLLGGALRPVFDRLKMSREKLAYLVDSTAAPVAGLAIVSTWIAVEIGYVQEGLDNLTPVTDASAFSLFVACIPYRFYVIQALLFVPLVAISGRDFGPMLTAERKAQQGGLDEPLAAEDPEVPEEQIEPTHWSNAVIPLAAMLAVIVWLLWTTGVASLGPAYDPQAPLLTKLRDVFGAASSSLALQYGALVGLGVALAIVASKKLLTGPQISRALVRGVLTVLPAVAILWFASSMSRMTGNKAMDGAPSTVAYEHQDHRLYTGEYLSALLLGDAGQKPSETLVTVLPSGVFLLSAVVAFCTGTSFGTMGLIVPMVVPLAWAVVGDTPNPTASPLFLASLGSVLAGAIFGDHCSPISDTTILSSQASGCDHMAHVRTQMPYALAVATVCVLLGTLPIGLGVSVWILLPLQTAALAGVLYTLGKRVDV